MHAAALGHDGRLKASTGEMVWRVPFGRLPWAERFPAAGHGAPLRWAARLSRPAA